MVKDLVYLDQKVQTDFAKGKGNDQSGNVENEVSVLVPITFLLNLHTLEGKEMRKALVIYNFDFEMSQFFGVMRWIVSLRT